VLWRAAELGTAAPTRQRASGAHHGVEYARHSMHWEPENCHLNCGHDGDLPESWRGPRGSTEGIIDHARQLVRLTSA